jgi:hypothetical protein
MRTAYPSRALQIISVVSLYPLVRMAHPTFMAGNTSAIKIRPDLASVPYLNSENQNEKNGKPKSSLPFFIPNRRNSIKQINSANQLSKSSQQSLG